MSEWTREPIEELLDGKQLGWEGVEKEATGSEEAGGGAERAGEARRRPGGGGGPLESSCCSDDRTHEEARRTSGEIPRAPEPPALPPTAAIGRKAT